MLFQTLKVYFPLQFVKNRITTIHSNSVVKNDWVPGSQELNIIAFKR